MSRLIHTAAFHPAHLDVMDVRDYELDLLGRDILAQMADTGQCVTLMIDGVLMAILGYFILRRGVLEVWVIPSKRIKQNAFLYIRFVKRYLEIAARNLGVHRIQTASPANAETDRWMRILGFNLEGTLKQYTTDKQDYRMWARIF